MHQQPEDRRAGAYEDAEEVERPQQEVEPAERRVGAEHRLRRRAPGSDGEGEHSLLAVPVVGDDAPADGVVPVRELGAQWQRQDVPVRGGLRREHGHP